MNMLQWEGDLNEVEGGEMATSEALKAQGRVTRRK